MSRQQIATRLANDAARIEATRQLLAKHQIGSPTDRDRIRSARDILHNLAIEVRDGEIVGVNI